MKPGDLVQFTRKFCQQVGMFSGGPVDGKVLEFPPGRTPLTENHILVHWCNSDEPVQVLRSNLKLKRAWEPN